MSPPRAMQHVAGRLCMALRRLLLVLVPGTLLVTIFISLREGSTSWWYTGRAHHEATDCVTHLHDYASIDRMFDEILLEPRTILLWSTLYGSHDFGFGLGQNPFLDHKCRNTNCITTSNRSAIDDADAVVFHWNELAQDGQLPPRRRPLQKYVYFNMEPPDKMSPESLEELKKYNGFFNLTMTYTSRSSIFNPFHKYTKRPNPAPKLFEEAKTNFVGKKKMVAWYAHCDEDVLGKAYVEELQKYISVDTYGPCGKIKCGAVDSAKCWDVFERDYLYFFSIESVMCFDYITERTFRPLQFNIVPIVYAGGNFSNMLPPNSHINVLGFPSPKNLADFLLGLSKNRGAYMWYMGWKENWQNAGWAQGFCDLCDSINNNRKAVRIVRDLTRFWSKNQCGKNFMDQFRLQWTA